MHLRCLVISPIHKPWLLQCKKPLLQRWWCTMRSAAPGARFEKLTCHHVMPPAAPEKHADSGKKDGEDLDLVDRHGCDCCRWMMLWRVAPGVMATRGIACLPALAAPSRASGSSIYCSALHDHYRDNNVITPAPARQRVVCHSLNSGCARRTVQRSLIQPFVWGPGWGPIRRSSQASDPWHLDLYNPNPHHHVL